jgi:amidase
MTMRCGILERDTLDAFCRHTHVALEGAASGPLQGTSFGVKDLYDIAGHRTGFGHPVWLETHPPARHTATAVQRLLDAGATMVGKTHTDELAYSLNGENRHYGTPLNPSAPARIPGGSSSGSASAVAAGLVDFALGSDTGGSVRVPASYCGVIGMRVTHGAVPLDGAIAFAPSFDTVGWFARDGALFERVGRVLLDDTAPAARPGRLLVAVDAFEHAEPAAAAALGPAVARISTLIGAAESIRLADPGLAAWMDDFRVIQAFEIWNTHREWVRSLAPEFGAGIAERFQWASMVDAGDAAAAGARRHAIRQRLDALLAGNAVIAMPTTVGVAPLRGTPVLELEAWRNRCLGLLCVAGHAGLPQISLPLATVDDCPLGLSLLAARGNDLMLLELARRLCGSSRSINPDEEDGR